MFLEQWDACNSVDRCNTTTVFSGTSHLLNMYFGHKSLHETKLRHYFGPQESEYGKKFIREVRRGSHQEKYKITTKQKVMKIIHTTKINTNIGYTGEYSMCPTMNILHYIFRHMLEVCIDWDME